MEKHPPREGDLPIDLLVRNAARVRERDHERGIETDILFKFTCEHCGERCTLEKPNTMFEKGECFKCGKETVLQYGGYTTVSKFPPKGS